MIVQRTDSERERVYNPTDTEVADLLTINRNNGNEPFAVREMNRTFDAFRGTFALDDSYTIDQDGSGYRIWQPRGSGGHVPFTATWHTPRELTELMLFAIRASEATHDH